jgi:aspartate racemase
MSWESTVPYYRIANQVVKAHLGGLHSARVVLYSVDFHVIEELQRDARWQEAGRMLADAAVSLERAGADFIVLCTNTMHKVAPEIEAAVSIPLLHIADVTAEAVNAAGVSTVGVLGTRFTMEQDFYVGRLREKHRLATLVPEGDDVEEVHRIIYEELCLGSVLPASQATYQRVIEKMILRGAQGIILGCTEISMLITPGMIGVPSFDTMELHARAAAMRALGDRLSR